MTSEGLLAIYNMYVWIIVTILLTAVYKYFTRNFDYWERRSVPHPKPLPLFGNFFDVFTARRFIGHFLKKYWNEYKTPYFGLYSMNTPILVIRSPELIKQILIKDFKYFCNRTNLADEKLDPIASKLLLLAKNPEWKSMRSRITPAFSTAKVKAMVPLITKVAEDMKLYLRDNADKSTLEAKEFCSKYSADIVASCGFGIDAHSFENDNAEFRVIGKKMFDFELLTAIRQVCYFFFPNVARFCRMPFLHRTVQRFMREVILSALEQRRKNKNERHDIIDVIIKIQNKTSIDDLYKFEGDRAVAQAGQFLTAGFDTISMIMSFTFYELCLQPNIQNKLRSEIKDVLNKHGEFNYEALQELKYLDMVIFESLRKYPTLPFLDRMCIENYKLPNSDLIIEKGTPVYITLFGLHYNPEYFPDPEKYDPERFSLENRSNLPDGCYIPFGDGPRSCIGEKLGLIIVKIGLAHVLSEFEVVRSPKTPVPISYAKKGILLASVVGLPIIFNRNA